MLVIVLAKVFLDMDSSVMKPHHRRPWLVYMCDLIAEPDEEVAGMYCMCENGSRGSGGRGVNN
jgi:hypothetical protein